MAGTKLLLSKAWVCSVVLAEALWGLRSRQSREEEPALMAPWDCPVLIFADFFTVSPWCFMVFALAPFS